MTVRVRLVATDMDGTLLGTDLTISERNRAAITAATGAGIAVVAATGRGWRSASPLLAVVPEITRAVCSNGALLRDLAEGTTLESTAIDVGALAAVLDAVALTVPDAGVAWELADGGFGYDAVYARLRPDVASPERIETPPVVDGVLKVLVRDPVLDEASLLERLRPAVPEAVEATFSGIDTVEITGDGVNKAYALARLCRRLGVDRTEVVAIGDNRNDAEMLAWAGRGVAMGNARPDAVAAADETTADHRDDGVAVVLEGLVAGLHA